MLDLALDSPDHSYSDFSDYFNYSYSADYSDYSYSDDYDDYDVKSPEDPFKGAVPDYSYDYLYEAWTRQAPKAVRTLPESDSYSENNSAKPENKSPDDYDYYIEMYPLSERSAIPEAYNSHDYSGEQLR